MHKKHILIIKFFFPIIIFIIASSLIYISKIIFLNKIFITFALCIIFILTSLFFIKNKYSIGMAILIIILTIVLYYETPNYKLKRWVNEGEKISYAYINENAIKLKNNIRIKKYLDKYYLYVYEENRLAEKIKLQNYNNSKHFDINVLKIINYASGNYKLNIINNLTKEERLMDVVNNASVEFNKYKIKILAYNDNFKNKYNKALKIKYTSPNSRNNHKHWILKEYPVFTKSIEKGDPLSFEYIKNEDKKKFLININYKSKLSLYLLILIYIISFMFITINFKIRKQ